MDEYGIKDLLPKGFAASIPFNFNGYVISTYHRPTKMAYTIGVSMDEIRENTERGTLQDLVDARVQIIRDSFGKCHWSEHL